MGKIDDLIQQLDEIKNGIAYAAGDYQYDSDASDLCCRVLELNRVLLAIVKTLAEQLPETKAKEDTPQWVVFNNRYGQQTVINLTRVAAMSRTRTNNLLWFADGEQDTIPDTVYNTLLDLLKPHKISDEQEAPE